MGREWGGEPESDWENRINWGALCPTTHGADFVSEAREIGHAIRRKDNGRGAERVKRITPNPEKTFIFVAKLGN